MNQVSIISTGSYVPSRIVKNLELQSVVKNYDSDAGKGSLDAWYQRHYGIKERRWAENELPSEMATKAAEDALKRAKINAASIDFLILNTAFGDYQQPTTATMVQKNLGIKEAFALEINIPCAGSIYGLVMAHNLLLSGRYKYGLVIGVEKMSLFIDKEDFIMAGLFGDGAGAGVVGISENAGIVDHHLRSWGEEGPEEDFILKVLGGKAKYPGYDKSSNEKDFLLQMKKGAVDLFLKETFDDVIKNIMSRHSDKKIDRVIPHQASQKLVLDALQPHEFLKENVLFTLPEFGNTSSASILLTLDKYYKEQFFAGENLLLIGAGGGLNWGGILLTV